MELTEVPEPGTLSILGAAFIGCGLIRRWRWWSRRSRQYLYPLTKTLGHRFLNSCPIVGVPAITTACVDRFVTQWRAEMVALRHVVQIEIGPGQSHFKTVPATG